MRENPNYYAIIPANVRYDTKLTPNAKLLYGEITALTNKEGHCWASNDYFARLYSVSKKSISLWIGQLIRAGYIESTLIYVAGGKEIESRYIRLCNDPMEKNVHTPMEEKVIDNITSSNITINTISSDKTEEQFNTFYTSYPKKEGKKSAQKAFNALIKKGVTLDDILSRLNTYQNQIAIRRTDLQYVKLPASFLNALEDYEPSAPKPAQIDAKPVICVNCGGIVKFGTCLQCGTIYGPDGKEVVL